MTKSPPTLTSEDAELLDQVILNVAQRYRLKAADAQDFTQSVHLRLLERGYDVFERFEGRCSKRGYLSVVVKRMALDWLNVHYGKWRPSTAACRMGATAVMLDRMIHRDGFSPAVAIALQSAQTGLEPTALQEIVTQLPVRARRRLVGIEELERECHVKFDDPIFGAEEREAAHVISRALSRLVQELPHEERRMLTLRYRRQQTVSVIAEQMGVDAKRLYHRFDRTLRTLRHKLAAQGITGPQRYSPAAH